MNSDALIELKAVDVSREGTHHVVLRGVDWQVNAGDFWAVAGDSGSGKSSLLETAAGLTRAEAGEVRILGQDVAVADEEAHLAWRRKIGFVFENGGRLLSQLTVAENIALPLLYHEDTGRRQAGEAVRAALEQAGLGEIEHILPSRLSLATQQRVGYLRAWIGTKIVMFVDHPIGRRWWPRMLKQLHAGDENGKGGVTVAVTCPDFRPWIDVANRFAIVRDGTFRIVGTNEELHASTDKSVTQYT